MANITTGTVQVVLSATSDKFVRGMKEAGDSIQRQIAGFASMATAATACAAPIAALVSVGVRYAQTLDDMSDATGLNAGQLVVLERAAINAGVAFEPIAAAATRLNATLGEARAGNEDAAKSFEKIGVSLEALSSASTYQRLQMVGDAIGKIYDQADRASAAKSIFGKDSAKILGLLNDFQGKIQEADVFSQDKINAAAERIEEAGAFWGAVWQRVKVEAMQTAAGLAMMVTPGKDQPAATTKGLDLGFGRDSDLYKGTFGSGDGAALKRQMESDAWIRKAAEANGDRLAQERADEELISDMRTKSRKDVEDLTVSLERMRVARMNGWEQEADAYAKRTAAITTARNLIGNTQAVEAAEQASTKEHLAAVDKLLSDSLNKRASDIKKWWDGQIQMAEDMARKRAEAEATATAAVNDDPRLAALRRSISLVGSSPAERAIAEREAAAMSRFSVGVKDPTQDPRALSEATVNELIEVERERHAEALREQERQDTQLRLSAYGDFFGNLDTLTKGAAEKSKEAFYINKAVQMAQAEINAWMAYSNVMAVESKLGATAANIMAATALAAGQVAVANIAAQQPPGRAAGGPVSAGGMYRVNEKGPELLTVGGKDFLMMGNKGGNVTPNGGSSPGGKVTVNVINNASGTTARAEESGTGDERTISVIIERVERAMAGSVAGGTGPLPRAMQSTYGLNRSRGSL
jgi:hypothetical protein